MKFIQINIILFFLLQTCLNYQINEFITNFFEDKNEFIVAHLCWPFDKIQDLAIKLYEAKTPKYITFNTKFETKYLNLNNTFQIVDMSCEDAIYFLEQANQLNLFTAPNKWLLIQSNGSNYPLILNQDILISILSNFNVLADSQVFGFIFEENISHIYQYYKINYNLTILRELYGYWNEKEGLTVTTKFPIISFRRRNFQNMNVRLTAVVLYNSTIEHLEDFRYPVEDMVTKAGFLIIKSLMQYVNANYTLLFTNLWGYRTSSGIFTGMVGNLIENKVDLTVSGMVFLPERAELIDFIKMIVPTDVVFFFRRPPLSFVQNIYTLPFTWTLWLAIVFLVIFAVILILIIAYWENEQRIHERILDMDDVFIIALSAICLQGPHRQLRSGYGRMITFLLFTTLMFLYVAYSANIVALLQSKTNDIQTLEDLLNSRLKCGAEDIVYNRFFLEKTNEPIRKAIYKEKIGTTGFYSAIEGITKVKHGYFSFLIEKGPGYQYILKYLDENEKCELQGIGKYIEASDTWIAVQQNSPFKEIFKIGLFKIDEYGLQKRILKRFYNKPQCSQSASSFTSVGLIDFYPALLLYLIGLLIATVVFCIEKILYKYLKK